MTKVFNCFKPRQITESLVISSDLKGRAVSVLIAFQCVPSTLVN